MEGSRHGIIKVRGQHFPEGTEESHDNFQSELQAFRMKLECTEYEATRPQCSVDLQGWLLMGTFFLRSFLMWMFRQFGFGVTQIFPSSNDIHRLETLQTCACS
jgi:hypothetical protein